MHHKHNPALTPSAKALRKNMTPEERRLWYCFLRNYPVRFLRQKVIGRYIADFYCASAKLVIELDGSQHFTQEGLEYDSARTEWMEQWGLSVIRITNREINNNFKGVCTYIDQLVKQSDLMDECSI